MSILDTENNLNNPVNITSIVSPSDTIDYLIALNTISSPKSLLIHNDSKNEVTIKKIIIDIGINFQQIDNEKRIIKPSTHSEIRFKNTINYDQIKYRDNPKSLTNNISLFVKKPVNITRGFFGTDKIIFINKKFSISFWLYLYKKGDELSNIFYYGNNENEKYIALWLEPYQPRFRLSISTVSNSSEQIQIDSEIQMYSWSHINISCDRNNLKLSVNNKSILSKSLSSQFMIPNNKKIYISSPWHKSTNAYISNFKYYPGHILNKNNVNLLQNFTTNLEPIFKFNSTIQLSNNQILSNKFKFKYPAYTYIFWIYPFTQYSAKKNNILHYGDDGNISSPSVSKLEGDQFKLIISVLTENNEKNSINIDNVLSELKWTKVVIIAEITSLKIYYDDKLIHTENFNIPIKTYDNNNLYASDPWNEKAPSNIKNLNIFDYAMNENDHFEFK